MLCLLCKCLKSYTGKNWPIWGDGIIENKLKVVRCESDEIFLGQNHMLVSCEGWTVKYINHTVDKET